MKKLPLFGCLELGGKFEGMDCSEDFRMDYLKKRVWFSFMHSNKLGKWRL